MATNNTINANQSGYAVYDGAGTWTGRTFQQGTGITLTNASGVAGNTTIASSGGGLSWVDVTGTTQTIAVNTGYLADNAGLVTLTLPATAPQFSIIAIVGNGAGGWKIAQNATQSIQFGSAASTTVGTGGSLASTNQYDTVYLIAAVGGTATQWNVVSSIGNLTIV